MPDDVLVNSLELLLFKLYFFHVLLKLILNFLLVLHGFLRDKAFALVGGGSLAV